MLVRWRLSLVMLVAAVCAATAIPAGAHSRRGPLTGRWSGPLSGSGVNGKHIVITVNAAETGGTWRIDATCHGSLALDSISDGYHHYRQELASGVRCADTDIDCLKRAGAEIYDAITTTPAGPYDGEGTLRRIRSS